eukprot:7387329-Prymnesium_polylepis.2
MCRKLALTGAKAPARHTPCGTPNSCVSRLPRSAHALGWLLLIKDDAEHARILLALLVTNVFLVLQLVISPLKRCAT